MNAKVPTLEDRKRLRQTFYDLPPKDDDQDPQVVNDIFNANLDELAARCKGLERRK